MPSVNETAYPRLKSHPTAKELAEVYTPNATETAFASKHARSPVAQVGLLVFLKTFQRLGYFPALAEISPTIVSHIARGIGLKFIPLGLKTYDETGARPRHAQLIRAFLNVTAVGPEAQEAMTEACINAAGTKDDLADIINVAIEELVRQRFELPAFSSMLRVAKSARARVNGGYHRAIYQALGENGRNKIDSLLARGSQSIKSHWDQVKQEPKSPTVGHMREFTAHLGWLKKLDLGEDCFAFLPDIKIRQFAAEAKSLDAASMRDLALHKRYAIAAALIRFQTACGLDDLAEMFVKRLQKIHQHAKDALDKYHLDQVGQTHVLVAMLHEVILAACKSKGSARERLKTITSAVGSDPDTVLEQCEAFGAFAEKNYLPFLPKFYKGARAALFELLESMPLIATSSDNALQKAIGFILVHRKVKSEWLWLADLDLSWISDKRWWPYLSAAKKNDQKNLRVSRRYFELCLLTEVMRDLKSGDLAIRGGDKFADYRTQLITWEEFEKERATYGEQVGIPTNGKSFVNKLRNELSATATATDESFPDNQHARFENGEVILSKPERQSKPNDLKLLDKLLTERMPQLNIIDILADTEYWTNWTKHFGPLSGHEAKIENPRSRYIATTFCYGCNLGPTQTAQSIKGIDRRQVSLVNQRHVTDDNLEKAIVEVINAYNDFMLPKIWGSGQRAAADGTKWDLYEQNLLSEYHIRYGGYGGIGYYHVSDTYIALFSHFIPCGVWEAVHILDGLLQNQSEIQPDILHGDTQAQSAPVFALAYLLGIKLMPRIRNWKDLKIFRPEKRSLYKNIDPLFDEVIDWKLIETHFQDMLRVAVSIKAGHITAATILRRLGTYSRKNKLYFAFRELGKVVRSIFLLNYLSDADLRRTITATTNKCESYNNFTQWVAFGGGGVIAENSREDQRKFIKYNHLVSSLVIIHNVDAMTKILDALKSEGREFSREALGAIAPYRTDHINRFGDYTLNLERRPEPLAYGIQVASSEI